MSGKPVKKNFKTVLKVTLLGFLPIFFVLALEQAAEAYKAPLTLYFTHVKLSSFDRALSTAFESGYLKKDEIQKLDFTLPWQEGFGDNLQFEVFNKESPRSIVKHSKPVLFSQEDIHALAGRKNAKHVFNLRKVFYEGHDFIQLVLITPMKEGLCEDDGFEVVALDTTIAPDNQTIVATPYIPRSDVCFKLPDGQVYMFWLLYTFK